MVDIAMSTAVHAVPDVLKDIAATQAQLHYTLHSLTDFVRCASTRTVWLSPCRSKACQHYLIGSFIACRAQSSAIVSLEIEQRAAVSNTNELRQRLDSTVACTRDMQRDTVRSLKPVQRRPHNRLDHSLVPVVIDNRKNTSPELRRNL